MEIWIAVGAGVIGFVGVSWRILFGSKSASEVLETKQKKNQLSENAFVKSSTSEVAGIPANLEFMEDPSTLQFRYAVETDFECISEIAESYLGKDHGVSVDTLSAWWHKNNKICKVVECFPNPKNDSQSWHICGYSIVLPLPEATTDLLKQGKIEDTDITARSLCGDYQNNISSLYIMDLMVSDISKIRPGASLITGYMTRDLVWSIQDILEGNNHIEEMLTLTASEKGKALAQKFGFINSNDYKSETGWLLWQIDAKDFNFDSISKFMPSIKKRKPRNSEYTV